MEQEEDRISILPKPILHNILLRLPKEDADRTRFLSSTWLKTWSTFPILSFSDTKITEMFPITMEDFTRKINDFIDYVKGTLVRYRKDHLVIKEFNLTMNNFMLHYMSKDVDLWLKLASESGIESLQLCLPDGLNQDEKYEGECYVLPKGIIEAKSLTILELVGGIKVDQAFMNHSIKYFSLRVLSLSLDFLLPGDEQAIKHLISCCPMIECISLKFWTVGGFMKSLSMHGLLKLKTVHVQGIEEIFIDYAPSLENFCCSRGILDEPFKVEITRCINLKELYLFSLKSTIITNEWFFELFENFPFLERLKLEGCSMSHRINIASVQLKMLELSICNDLNEVNICAPNLLSCIYSGGLNLKPIINFVRSSSQLEVNAQINISYLHICGLRQFLENIKPQNVLTLCLTMFQQPVDVFFPAVFQVSSPPPTIKHLHLCSNLKNETLFPSVVSILLSSCRPTSISVTLHPCFCSRAFIEFLYETLMGRKGDVCFCRSSQTKCWWHDLKDVKFTSSIEIDENVDFKTMLLSLPAVEEPEEEYIYFMLEF